MPARAVFKKYWDQRKDFHPSGEFIYFEDAFCPWKGNLFHFEEEENCEGKIKFVFFKDNRGMFRASTVPPKPNSFEQRVPLHKDWRGLKELPLQEKSGIADASFVHASGFIGGAWSLESVLKMALLSIEEFKLT